MTLSEKAPMFTIATIARVTGRSPRWVLDQVHEGKLTASFEEKHSKKTTRLFSVRDVRRYSPSIAEALIEDWEAKQPAA